MKFFKFMLEVLHSSRLKKGKSNPFASSPTEAGSYKSSLQQKQGLRQQASTEDVENNEAVASFLENIPSSELYRHFKDFWDEPPAYQRSNFPSKRLLTSGQPASHTPPSSSHSAIEPEKSAMSVDEAIDYAFGPLAAKHLEEKRRIIFDSEPISPAQSGPDENQAAVTDSPSADEIAEQAVPPDLDAISLPISDFSEPAGNDWTVWDEARHRKGQEFTALLVSLLGENIEMYHAAVISNDGHILAQESTYNTARAENAKLRNDLTDLGPLLVELKKMAQQISAISGLREVIIQGGRQTTMLFDADENGFLATTVQTEENLGMAVLDSRAAAQRIGKLLRGGFAESPTPTSLPGAI